MDALNSLANKLRRCAEDYAMLSPGDRVAVAVSGGKDSLALLCALARLREFYPVSFTLEALTADMGYPGTDWSGVAALCRRLGVEYAVIPTRIREIVFEGPRDGSRCALCARLRRGALLSAAEERGCTKLALGHHRDDAAETFLMNLLFEGRLACFEPVTLLEDRGLALIRPMLYAGGRAAAALAEALDLPVVKNPCPLDGAGRRQEVRELIARLSEQYPDLKSRIFDAMGRLPLPGWELRR